MFRHATCATALAALLGASAAAAQAPDSAPPQDLTLAQALQYAVDHYPAIRAAVETSTATTAGIDVARAASLPRLDAVWQANRATVNNVTGLLLPQSVVPPISGPPFAATSNSSVWGSAAGALLSWEAVDFGRRTATLHEAEAGLTRAKADERVLRLQVQQTVGLAFLSLVDAQQAVRAANADVERRAVLGRAIRALVDSQLRPGAEASRADAELAAARTRALRARQAQAVAEASLLRALGASDGPATIRAASLVERLPDAGSGVRTSAEHPLLQASDAAVAAAAAREETLATTSRPRLYLQSSLSARGTGVNADGSFDGGANGLGLERANWAAGVQVVFPNLFEFSTLKARQVAAGALTRAERARTDEARLNVTHQQRTADALLEAARAIAENTPVQLAAAEQTETRARARYEAGLTDVMEVAEAQNLLAAAEYENAAAHVDVWRALLMQAVANGRIDDVVAALGSVEAP